MNSPDHILRIFSQREEALEKVTLSTSRTLAAQALCRWERGAATYIELALGTPNFPASRSVRSVRWNRSV